ncbi:sensor histidine kinase [Thalassotalea fusca]
MESNIKNYSSFEQQLHVKFSCLLLLQFISLALFCLVSSWTFAQSLAIATPIMAIAIWQSRIIVSKVRSLLCVLVNSLEHINSSSFNTSPYLPYKKGVLHSLNIEYAKLQEQLQQANFDRQKDAYIMYQLIEQLETPILLFDHRGLLVNANPTSKLFLGQDWRILKGTSMESIGLTITGNNQIKCIEQNDVWSVKSCISTSGENKFHLVLMQNIEQELRAKELSSWHKLIKVIGHEVRNSLTPIYALSHALADDLKHDENKHQALTVIANRSKSLQSFINRTTELANIPKPKIEAIDIKRKIEECCDLISGVDYEIQVSTQYVYADPIQIEQVLLNLIKNADESMTEKSPILVSVFEYNNGTKIAIKDLGTGIYEENNLFVPFYTTKEHGSGIGLPLCKQIIDAHSGTIFIKNNSDGLGVTATVWLPTPIEELNHVYKHVENI